MQPTKRVTLQANTSRDLGIRTVKSISSSSDMATASCQQKSLALDHYPGAPTSITFTLTIGLVKFVWKNAPDTSGGSPRGSTAASDTDRDTHVNRHQKHLLQEHHEGAKASLLLHLRKTRAQASEAGTMLGDNDRGISACRKLVHLVSLPISGSCK